MSTSKILFKVYYIGRKKYFGSQRQLDFLTIEQCLLNALKEKSYIQKVGNSEFEFASRTDRYVSARGACFTCVTEKKPILMEINSILPKEIGIWAYAELPKKFSSRRNAILRHYVYFVPTPISYLREASRLNLGIMEQACKELEGRHNFANFSKKESNEMNTIRDLDSVSLSIKNDYLIFQFKSRAFLRQQIRRMVKKILELGKNEITYDDFLKLFDPFTDISYQPSDPRGLILWDIKFDETVNFKEDLKSKERMKKYFLIKEITYNLKYNLFRTLQQDDFCQ